MLLHEAYKALTAEMKAQAREEILALCDARGMQCSRSYLTLLLQGQREHPCGQDLARLVSGYFRGMIGLSMSPDDVLNSVKSACGKNLPSEDEEK